MAHQTANFLQSILRELASRAAEGSAYRQNWGDEFVCKQIQEVWKDDSAAMRRPRKRRLTLGEIASVPIQELRQLGFAAWDDKLTVIPLWAWNYIADGEEFICIDGSKAIKGKDNIDLDVRGGCIAFGFATPEMQVAE